MIVFWYCHIICNCVYLPTYVRVVHLSFLFNASCITLLNALSVIISQNTLCVNCYVGITSLYRSVMTLKSMLFVNREIRLNSSNALLSSKSINFKIKMPWLRRFILKIKYLAFEQGNLTCTSKFWLKCKISHGKENTYVRHVL